MKRRLRAGSDSASALLLALDAEAAGDDKRAIGAALDHLALEPRSRRAQRLLLRLAAQCDGEQREQIATRLDLLVTDLDRPALRQLEALRIALALPQSAFADSLSAALARKHDATILDAMLLAALECGLLEGATSTEQARALLPSLVRSLATPRRTRAGTAGGQGATLADDDRPVVVAVVDAPTEACIAPHLRLITPAPSEVVAALDTFDPDVVFVESTWMGNGGRWAGAISKDPNLGALRLLVAEAKRLGIPTIFWNKEDPLFREHFAPAAVLFDRILTTDAASIEFYREVGPTRDIAALPFAVQPVLHNPIGRAPDPTAAPICFAGSWYPGIPGRTEATEMLLDAARPFGLAIYDRYAEASGGSNKPFPERFAQHVVGSLPPDEVPHAFRRHAVVVNINSITDSPTMFARRAFEALACGAPVVTNESRGMRELLGTDGIRYCSSAADATAAYADLLAADMSLEKELVRAGRLIMATHTYRYRLDQAFEGLGIELVEAPRTVTIVTVVDSDDDINCVLRGAARQVRAEVEVLMISSTAGLTHPRGDASFNIELDDNTDDPAGRRLKRAIERAAGTTIAFWHPANYYGPSFLADAVDAFEYASSDAVVRGEHFRWAAPGLVEIQAQGARHVFTTTAAHGSLVTRRNLFPTLRIPRSAPALGYAHHFVSAIVDQGGRVYATHPYDFASGGTSDANVGALVDA